MSRRHAAALVLRDVLRYRYKFGCGNGLCGACTVHIDGRGYPLLHHDNRQHRQSQVTTIEGIGATPAGAGSRKPGSIMKWSSALLPVGTDHVVSALLASKRNRTDADIDEAMSRQHLAAAGPTAHPRGDQPAAQSHVKAG